MEKLKMQTPNLAEEKYKKLAELFPNAITETKDENGNTVRAIDKDVLMQEINTEVVEGNKERYQFTWPDKQKYKNMASRSTTSCLRPCREESINFDNTGNIYVEGDNLEVLKIMRTAYQGKVKMIYIDPPYNTGGDFIYEDNFTQNSNEYKINSNQYNSEGERMKQNLETNGRFHTDWLNMIYPRLKIARDLLSKDGVIFISIDDNEQENMKKCCSEIFGSDNFIAELIWERAYSPKNDAKYISNSHDYVLMFSKDIDSFKIGRLPRTAEANSRYKNMDNDPRGVWKPSDLSVKTYTPSCDYPITAPSGRVIEPPTGRCWRLSKKAFLERLQDNRIWFGTDGDSVPSMKRFLSELKYDGLAPTSILFYKEVGHSQEGAKEVVSLFDNEGVFDGPKPVRLLQRLITLANLEDGSIVLDFFSGSATTAHALMKVNAEEEKHCKFIMVQLPELIDKKKRNVKYDNICEIGKERIRRAGNKIKEDYKDNENIKILDTGFRVLKCDSSNMKDVYYNAADLSQSSLFDMVDNIKEDRTPEDLLFQVMLEKGALLSSKIERKTICGKEVFCVEENYLIACFDEKISEDIVVEIAKMKPYYFVIRDNSMSGDSVAVNFEQIVATYSPETKCEVL